jgi:metal-responsive CopG/Arc/MetJ family transcriptional regulator
MATVKTAISLEDSLFKQVEALAKKMKVSRSRLFALALEEFLRRHQNQQLLEQLNAAYDDAPDPEEEALLRAARHSYQRLVNDEW